MSLKIIEHKKNPLMKRDEIRAVVEHAGKPTPTRDEILPSLENVLKTGRDLILIDRIFTERGKGESNIRVFVYQNKEDVHKQDLERSGKKKAKGGAKAGPSEEKEAPKHEGHKEAKEKKT